MNHKTSELVGQAALITGASAGLGRALAKELALSGVRVALVARREAPLYAAVADIRACGGEAHAVIGDVGDKHAVLRIAGQAHGLLGDISIVVHNASRLGPTPLRLLMDTECEDFSQVLETNLLGPFRLSKALLGGMILRGSGVLVHVSSDAAVEAYPRWGAYGVSKAAQDQLSRIFAAELADTGVRIITVDPGEMNTAMHAAAIPEADPQSLPGPETVARRVLAMIADAAHAPNGARLSAAQWEAL